MDGCQVAKLSWLASLGSAPMNHSRVSSRRGRKPSQGRGERFKRGSATQFDRRNSKVRSVAMGDPAYRQALSVHSALDLKAGVWDGPQVESHGPEVTK